MNFIRGKDPKESLGIGKNAILKEIGGKILDEKEFKKWKKFKFNVSKDPENVVILVTKGTYEVIKNLIRFDDPKFQEIRLPKGLEKDLIDLLLKLREGFRKYGANFFLDYNSVNDFLNNRVYFKE